MLPTVGETRLFVWRLRKEIGIVILGILGFRVRLDLTLCKKSKSLKNLHTGPVVSMGYTWQLDQLSRHVHYHLKIKVSSICQSEKGGLPHFPPLGYILATSTCFLTYANRPIPSQSKEQASNENSEKKKWHQLKRFVLFRLERQRIIRACCPTFPYLYFIHELFNQAKPYYEIGIRY